MARTGVNYCDGDTFAMYLPLTKEANKDVDKMSYVNNMLPPGSLKFDGISQNVIYGLWKITRIKPNPNKVEHEFSTLEEFVNWYKRNNNPIKHLLKTIKIGDVVCTVAHAYVSHLLGLDQPVVKPMSKKILHKYLTETLQKYYIEGKDYDISRIEELFKLGTVVSHDLTLSLNDLYINKEAKEKIRKAKESIRQRFKNSPRAIKTNIAFAKKLLDSLSDDVLNIIGKNFKSMLLSGAKGSKSQISQIFLAKGFITDITNKIIAEPILSSFIEGLTPKEFLLMTKASRKGSADRSIRTSEPGDLTRKLIFALNPVELDPNLESCGTNQFLEVTLTDKNKNLFIYRYIHDNGKDVLLTHDNIDNYVGQTVKLYSPIFCKSRKICRKCYGEYDRYLKSPYIGMIASQSLGERATQLIMRTFHTGGSADVGEIDFPQHLIEEQEGIIKTKEDLIIIDELSIGTTGSPITFTVIDPSNDESYTVSLPAYSEILKHSDGHEYVRAGTAIAKLPDTSTNIVGAIEYVRAILESSKIRDLTWDKLYKELLKIFGEDLGVLSIWYEILVSQLMRDPDDPVKLWRLREDRENVEPMLMTVRQIPFMRLLLALAFQNIGKSLSLITEHIEIDINDLTVLEKIFLARF